jgi:hypothetical protein
VKISESYPPECGGQGNGIKCVRTHIHKFLHEDLTGRNDIRKEIAFAKCHENLYKCFDDIEALNKAEGHVVENEVLAWYMRYRVPRRSESNPIPAKIQRTNDMVQVAHKEQMAVPHHDDKDEDYDAELPCHGCQ